MRRLLKVTAMTGMLTCLKMVIGFVIAKVVSIYTGPTGLAMLGQLQSFLGSINGVVNAPVSNGIVRFTAEYKDLGYSACAPWWRAAIKWVLILMTFIFPLGLILSEYIAGWIFQNGSLKSFVVIAIYILPLSAFGTLCNSIINGQQLYRRYVALGIISTLGSGVIMLGMIVMMGIHGALLAAVMQSALIGLVMLIYNFKEPWFRFRYWWGETDTGAMRAIGGYMLMAITSALVVPISLILVRKILINEVGWSETGEWQAVWRISEAYLSVITVALGTYYLPRLSSLSGIDNIIKEINNTAKVVIPIVVIMSISIYLLRDIIISLLFTDEFSSARSLFGFQLAGDVIKISAWLYAYPMISKGATRWFVFSEVFFSILFVLICYLCIAEFGVQGAVLGYLINYSVYFFFVVINVKRVLV